MARTKTTRAKKPLNPWDIAQTWEVIRGNQFEPPSQLEPGVKFFVEMLEQLDCTTISSCEGHPGGFYILFTGVERTVREIAACGYLTIEVERTPGNYRLSLQGNEYGHLRQRIPWTNDDRESCLRGAADAWVAKFGPPVPPMPPRLPGESLPAYKSRLRELRSSGISKL
jgi:hypothetical protein